MRPALSRHWPSLAAMAVASVLALAACGGGSSSTSKTANGPLTSSTHGTLQEWNWDTVADSPGSHAVLQLAIKAFEKKYPHVKVVDTEMTLTEQNDKLPLGFASSSSAPTVSQTNEGYQSMGRLVTDKELLPLASYNKRYHWFSEVGQLPLQYNSFTADGKSFGSGNVYGIPWTGTVVGIFYNKKMLAEVGGTPPTSWSVFTRDLALLKSHGKIALAYSGGQPTAYQPVHTLYTIANQFVPASQSNAFVFHRGNASIDTPAFVRAATIFQQWTRDGYFSPGYAGLSDAQALSQFTSGQAGFFIEGDWYISSVWQALKNNAGFWVPKVATGGPGEGWSIPANSSDPSLAAAWINELLSPAMQAAQLKAGDVPVVSPSASALAGATPLLKSAVQGWRDTVSSKSLVPYLDYATPDFLNQEMAGIQELQANQTTPAELMKSLQSDYTSYWSQHS